MATRSSTPGAIASGDFAVYTQINAVPGGLIGYVQTTTNQTGITTAVDMTAGTALTLTVTPSSASRILRIGYVFNIVSTVNNDNCKVVIVKDGSTFDTRVFPVSTPDQEGCAAAFAIDIAPTHASHTYKLQFGRTGTSSGTWSTSTASTQPASLFIWDEGASF